MIEHDPAGKLRLLGWCLHGAGLAAVLATAGISHALVLRPLERRTGTWLDHAARLEERLAGSDVLCSEQARLAQSATRLERQVASLARRVPNEPLEGEFLSQVAAIAGQVGLKIGNYRPGVIRIREGHSHMEIQLSCVGPYRSLCRFLDRIAALERLSRVVQMEVSAGTAEGCPATITLVVFFRLTEPPAPSPAAREGGTAHG